MQLQVKLTKQLGDFRFATAFAVTGTRIGVFGPSGSGKSTLGNLLTGALRPDEGTIQLDQRRLFDRQNRINLPPDQRRIAVVFQHAHLFPHLSVENNLLFGYRRTAAARRRLQLDEVTNALDIAGLLPRCVDELSGGEKQRVALGRALLFSPDLLVLDEPLSALDQGLKDQIIPFLRKTLRRFAIPYLYISHSLREMRLLTEQVLVFDRGQLQQISDAETLARARLRTKQAGYCNHLVLTNPREVGNLLGYRWGKNELLLTDTAGRADGTFSLDATDLLLCKNLPTAISARNLLRARVVELLFQGDMVAVRLDCHGEELIARIVHEAALELDLQPGGPVYIAIKASAFRRLL